MTEIINGYDCKVYSACNVELITTTRMELLIDADVSISNLCNRSAGEYFDANLDLNGRFPIEIGVNSQLSMDDDDELVQCPIQGSLMEEGAVGPWADAEKEVSQEFEDPAQYVISRQTKPRTKLPSVNADEQFYKGGFCSKIEYEVKDYVTNKKKHEPQVESLTTCHRFHSDEILVGEIETAAELKMRTYIENKMSEAIIRICPYVKCGRPMVKYDDCNMVMCDCGQRMCYVCREKLWSQPFCHFRESDCPRESDTDELHRREMAAAGLRAKEEFVAQHPEYANVQLKHDPTTKENVEAAVAAANSERPPRRGLAGFDNER